jgi:hypothetical protein
MQVISVGKYMCFGWVLTPVMRKLFAWIALALIVGADNAGTVLANADLGAQGRQCFIPFAATIVEVEVAGEASDTKMSFGGDFSVEGVIKLEEFHREWTALIAGSDISQAPFVLNYRPHRQFRAAMSQELPR